MNETSYKPSPEEINQAESMLSTEEKKASHERATEQIEQILIDEYKQEIDQQDPYEQMVIFRGFESADIVRETLEKKGIDLTGMEIEVKRDIKDYPYKDGTHGGDAYPGTQVKITSDGKTLVDRFFESPDEKYEY